MTYRWANPHEWLFDKAHDEWTPEQLFAAFRDIVEKCDADTLQDLFQTEMDRDGYFDEIKPE
jgi:hypothetical protein